MKNQNLTIFIEISWIFWKSNSIQIIDDYNFDNFIANEDMQSFSSDSGYESLVSDDDDVD